MSDKRPVFADLADLEEDKRIDVIGHHAVDQKKVVGFVVEDDVKARRYIAKLQEKFPGIQVIYKGMGPVFGTTLVKVGPPAGGQS